MASISPFFSHPRVLRRRVAPDAFSLVEMILALGIVSFAFLPLLGMLPAGLTAMRGAADRTAVSRIVQRIGNEAQQSDFDRVTSSTEPRFFDNQGQELPSAQSSESIYQSRIVVLSDSASPHLKRLVIQVARNPGGTVVLKEETLQGDIALWSEEDNTLPVITRSLFLARSSSIPSS